MGVVAQRHHEHYKVIRKMIGKICYSSRRTYTGLLIATKETNRSYIRWSISAPSYADVIETLVKRRGTHASSPSSFSRCSIAHFQKDSWYVCDGEYCSKCGLRRIEDSRKSCTWRNGRSEGNNKNRGCSRAEYACKMLNKEGSEDGITVIVTARAARVHIADAYQPALNRSRAPTDPFAFRFAWRSRDNFMLSHRHLLRQCARPKILRSFSSTSRVDFPAQTRREGEEQGEGDNSVPSDPSWGTWKKTIGKQFEKPHRPCNWLGGKVVEFVSVWY
jgi:hypothetical protein